MRNIKRREPGLDHAKRAHHHMRIHMPHMADAEKPVPGRIIRFCHAKPDPKGKTGLLLDPFAQA